MSKINELTNYCYKKWSQNTVTKFLPAWLLFDHRFCIMKDAGGAIPLVNTSLAVGLGYTIHKNHFNYWNES